MDRSTIKLELLESLVTDEIIHDSAANNLTDSAPCCSGTVPEEALRFEQDGLMNNSVNLGMDDETQNVKMENSLIEPSLRTISNLVVIAPQDDDSGKCKLFQTNRKRPYSPDHQEDINQHPIIPAVKQEIMDTVISQETDEDVPEEEITVKQVRGKINTCEEHIKLEEDINCPWLDDLKETDHTQAQPVMKNEMSEDRDQEDLIKSERFDGDFIADQTSKLSGKVHERFHHETSTVTSYEGSDYDESGSLRYGEELDKEENTINDSKSVHHLNSDHSDSQSNAESLENHSLTHHQSNESFKCPDCDKEFQQLRYLKNHAVVHADINPIICPVCGLKFQCKNGLSKHQSVHNCEKASSLYQLQNHQIMKKPYLCTTCDRSFMTRQHLEEHQRTHTGERPYRCTTCDKSFITQQALQRHMRTHTGEKPYACTQCDKSFRAQYHLKVHQRTHTGEKPYACSLCDRSFRILQALQSHQRIHTGEKPYACITCDKSFMTQLLLTVHQRTHTEEKPFACSTCDKSFRTQLALQSHERTHTGEKPYGCTACDKSFRTPQAIHRHQRTHTGEKPYACTTCDKSFMTLQHLEHHQRTHTGRKS